MMEAITELNIADAERIIEQHKKDPLRVTEDELRHAKRLAESVRQPTGNEYTDRVNAAIEYIEGQLK